LYIQEVQRYLWFWVKIKCQSLYYSGFRCEKPSEYYAAVCSIFNSCPVGPSIITGVEGCKGREVTDCPVFAYYSDHDFGPLTDWLEDGRQQNVFGPSLAKNVFCNHHF
jgi:hypothetical protein